MKKVLLINQGHTQNLGDILISEVMSRFFIQQGFEVDVQPYDDIVQNRFRLRFDSKNIIPKIVERIPYFMDYANSKRIRALLDRKKYDFAVIGGGELLASHYGFNSSFVTWCRLLREKHIPVYVHGVSGDTEMSDFYLKRYKRALKTCQYVSARDHSTESILQNVYSINASYCPDVVFSYKHFFELPLEDKTGDVICVPMPINENQLQTLGLRDRNDFYCYLAKLIEKNDISDSKRIIITSTEAEDMDAVIGFYRYCLKNLRYDFKLVVNPTVNEFIGLLAKSSCVVSCRMHACILGLLSGNDIIPVPFKEKLAVFAREYSNAKVLEDTIEQSYAGLLNIVERFKQCC